MDIKSEIYRVFQAEIDALGTVRDRVDEAYIDAVNLLYACEGKVVVTGMGKSGHIAKKIAATMVSTGTSSIFLHPAEALHGDAGIIEKGDVAIAISKSGETEELQNLLPYIKNIGVPIITITGSEQSGLARSADVVLNTPIIEEACPLDLAPTSSTTAALVVGDALAIALMKLRGFKPENFALRHPGGQLGKQLLLRVEDTMRSDEDNPIVNVTEPITHMIYVISNKRCGAVSVVDDEGRLVGLVTDYDIRTRLKIGSDFFAMRIEDVMNINPVYTYSDEMAVNAMQVMRNRSNPFLVLPVLNRNNEFVVGMLHLNDLLDKGL